MRRKVRQGSGMLVVVAVFCVLTSIVAVALARLSTGVFILMDVNKSLGTAQKIAEGRAAMVRGVSYASLKALGKTRVRNLAYTEEVVLGSETGRDGFRQRPVEVKVFDSTTYELRASMKLFKTKELDTVTDVSECPVGALAYFSDVAAVLESRTSDWLSCNGAEFDVNRYPKLYQVLGTNKVPDLLNKFFRGYGSHDNTHRSADTILGYQSYGVYPLYGSFWTFVPTLQRRTSGSAASYGCFYTSPYGKRVYTNYLQWSPFGYTTNMCYEFHIDYNAGSRYSDTSEPQPLSRSLSIMIKAR